MSSGVGFAIVAGVATAAAAVLAFGIADVWTAYRRQRRLVRRNPLAGHILATLDRHGPTFRWKCRCGYGDFAPTVDDVLEAHWSHATTAEEAAE